MNHETIYHRSRHIEVDIFVSKSSQSEVESVGLETWISSDMELSQTNLSSLWFIGEAVRRFTSIHTRSQEDEARSQKPIHISITF